MKECNKGREMEEREGKIQMQEGREKRLTELVIKRGEGKIIKQTKE